MLNVGLEEAVAMLLAHTIPIERVEVVALEKALHRVLAQDITAKSSNPPFDRSPLDGYAFRAVDSVGATKACPVTLKVIGTVYAGEYFEQEVGAGEAVRIMTGAPIPRGCDCVLRQEDTDEGDDIVALYTSLNPYENYCFQGEDIKAGVCVLRAGEKLSSVCLGVLASIGIKEVTVKAKVKMALICTGDEIITLEEQLTPGKIYNSNGYMLQARAEELGIALVIPPKCEDNPQAVADLIHQLAKTVDIIVTTGGVSVGKKDILHDVLPLVGAKRLFWRVQIQPGTPVLASCIGNKLMISLSGNPFAALTNFELLVRPVVAKLGGDQSLAPRRVTLTLGSSFLKASKKRRFIRATMDLDKVYLNHTQHASGALYSMHGCNCLIDIAQGTEALHAGDQVSVVIL